MRIQSVIFPVITIALVLCLQGCPPTETHEETVTIQPVNINTFNETTNSDNLCRGGLAPDQPGPGQFITGFFHRFNNDDGCWVNQIYQGLVRFQIDAAPFNKRLIKSAVLTIHTVRGETNPPRASCIDKMGLTDIPWWSLPNTGRIHLSDLRNVRSIVPPAVDAKIDVTNEVQHWANNTDVNNGFVFIGQRPEMSDFSNTGMLTNETCEAFYDNISLTVTFFQFNNPAHHPVITTHAVHTQTTADITVNGSDFTPKSSVRVFADDIPGQMASLPIGSVTTDSNGKFQFFYSGLCTKQPDSATIRTLDEASGDNARSYVPVFCH